MKEGFNRVVLFGNLGADPELRRFESGQNMLRMRLATHHSFVNRDGVREDRAEWHSITLWGNRAEGLSRILHKGSFLLVEGHIRSYSYEKDGQKKFGTEVLAHNVILGGRCGPSGHGDGDQPEEGEGIGEAATMRDEGLDLPEAEARRDKSSPPREPREPREPHEPEPFEPISSRRPPRGDNGTGGAAAPPPPAPRKKVRTSGGAPAMAAA